MPFDAEFLRYIASTPAKKEEGALRGAFLWRRWRCARCSTARITGKEYCLEALAKSTENKTLPGTPRRAPHRQPPTLVAARWMLELQPRVMPARCCSLVARDAQSATGQSIFSRFARNSARWNPFHSAIELRESKTGHSPSYGLPQLFFGSGRCGLRLDQTSLLSLTYG